MKIRQNIIDKGIEQFFENFCEVERNDIGVLEFVSNIAEDLEMTEEESNYFEYQLPFLS